MYYCDNARHLICVPYSIENLHSMAVDLGIKRCWFHKDHYDIPKLRIEEIKRHARVRVISSRDIVILIYGIDERDPICERKIVEDFSCTLAKVC